MRIIGAIGHVIQAGTGHFGRFQNGLGLGGGFGAGPGGDGGVKLAKTYTFSRGSYQIDVAYDVTNAGTAPTSADYSNIGVTGVTSGNLAAINTALAELANVSVEHSDVLQGITGSFDLIVANPPYMLDAGARAYRHGGGTLGAGLSLRIVNESLGRLTHGGSLLLYTGVAMIDGHDPFLAAIRAQLNDSRWSWHYQELDPDVFGEQLLEPGYQQVERIAAVGLTVTRNG